MARSRGQEFEEYSGQEMALVEFRWRGIGLPTSNLKTVLRQDLAVHSFVSRDGADVEATGRAPLEISCRIPLVNNIKAGTYETWNPGELYPNVWRSFLLAMADRTTGEMQHPALGVIKCKPSHCESDWDAATRDGIFVDASWIETTDDANSLAAIIGAISPVAQANQAARDLDTGLKQITPPLPSQPEFQPTFEDSMRSIQGTFDQVTLLSRSVAGRIDNVAYRLDLVTQAITTAAKSPADAVNHVIQWPIRDAIDRLKSALDGVRENLLKKARPIGVYFPADDTTLPLLTLELGVPIGDLMALNPKLLAIAYVPRNSLVRYYLS